MSKPLADPVFDIGRDLQRAYEEGYKQGRYDEMVETEMSLPKWIPVSERLPIPPTFCLVTTDGSHGDVIDIALYMSDGWHKASEVLAWMPLPEPYREGWCRMTRLIDADALSEKLCETTIFIKDGEVFQRMINDAPSIDAVPVVRCGECEYWKCNPNTEEYGVCKKVSYDDFEVVMDSDDFCSYGKRREDGEA